MLFIGTFFICLFIFMMQFLWRYVDELVGKGLEMSVMAQFFFYSALTLVPVSLPLAVLLASLITFGNFGERYELLAMKAAGISLLKIMRPLAFFVCGLVGVSFYFQNVVGPIAQAKLGTLILSMKQKSPELDIPEGVFYSEIKGVETFEPTSGRRGASEYFTFSAAQTSSASRPVSCARRSIVHMAVFSSTQHSPSVSSGMYTTAGS